MPRVKKDVTAVGNTATGESEVSVTCVSGVGSSVKSEKSDTSKVSVRKFSKDPAKVTFDVGITLNLGNYEFSRIGVSVSIPCYAEEIDETYRYAQSWAKSRLRSEISAARGSDDAAESLNKESKPVSESEHPF